MYEKYNAYEVGVGGGGGEYVPQVGFGWTNGVALYLLNSTLSSTDAATDTSTTSSSGIDNTAIVIVCVLVGILALCVAGYTLKINLVGAQLGEETSMLNVADSSSGHQESGNNDVELLNKV